MLRLNRLKVFKKRSVYLAFLFSYVLLLLVTLSSGFVYYAKINQQITDQTEATKQLLLKELRSDVESNAAYIESISNEITFNTKIEQFAKGIPSVTLSEVQKELALKQEPGDILFDYFIYIKNTDEIITSNIRMKAETFFDVMYSFVDLDWQSFRSTLDEVHFQHYMPIQFVEQYTENHPIEILPFVQTFPVGTKQKPLGQVIFFINANKLFSIVDSLHQATDSDVYIFDEKDVCIVSSGGAPKLEPKLLSDVAGGKVTEDAILFKQVSSNLGWKFVVSTPKSLFYLENRNFMISMSVTMLFYLAIGIGLIYILTELSYRPLREIRRLIDSSTLGEEKSKNEFEVIKTTLQDQMKNDKELNSIIASQLPIVRKEVLDNLIKGLVSNYDEMESRLADLQIIFKTNRFLVISIEVAQESEFFKSDDSSLEQMLPLARLITKNIACELLEQSFLCNYLDFGQYHCVFLLNLFTEEDIPIAVEQVKQKISELMEFADQNFLLKYYAGISFVHHSLKSIPLCFDESRKALEQHKLHSDKEPVEFAKLENLDADYYYPSEMEYQMVGYLKVGDCDKAKQLIDSIIEINTRKKHISTSAARCLLFEIASVLQKLMVGVLLSQGKERLESVDFDRFLTTPNLELAKKDFYEIIDRFSEQRAELKSSNKTSRLVDSIAVFIEQNLEQNWLDLNGLSQEFDVTPQYISNIFKRYKNENVKDYISKLRLEKAKELLKKTNLAVKEIAARLGYTGEIGIIRLFKKYEGMTPGEYRNQFRKE